MEKKADQTKQNPGIKHAEAKQQISVLSLSPELRSGNDTNYKWSQDVHEYKSTTPCLMNSQYKEGFFKSK